MNVPPVSFSSESRHFAPPAQSIGSQASSQGNTAQQVHAATQQFEQIILRQLLEPVVSPLMSSGGGASGGGGVYGYMVTDVLANQFSQGGGLGFSHVLENQFKSQGADPLVSAENMPEGCASETDKS